MNRLLSALFVVATLAGCNRSADEDLVARVEALEARYHTQSRQIEDLQAKIAALETAKPATVIDLVPAPPQ